MSAAKNHIPRWKKLLYFPFHFGLIYLLGSGFVWSYNSMTTSNSFAISKINISGNKILSAEEIKKYAGIKNGENILKLNLEVLRRKLENNAWIKKAEIKRSLPSLLEINVSEEDPVAMVSLDSHKYILNKKGTLFKPFEKKDIRFKFPMIEGLDVESLKSKDFRFQSIMKLLSMEKNSQNILFPGNYSKISMDRDTGICIYNTAICKKLILGFEDLDYKYHTLQRLTFYINKKFPGQKLEKIDISEKKRIVIKPFPAMG